MKFKNNLAHWDATTQAVTAKPRQIDFGDRTNQRMNKPLLTGWQKGEACQRGLQVDGGAMGHGDWVAAIDGKVWVFLQLLHETVHVES